MNIARDMAPLGRSEIACKSRWRTLSKFVNEYVDDSSSLDESVSIASTIQSDKEEPQGKEIIRRPLKRAQSEDIKLVELQEQENHKKVRTNTWSEVNLKDSGILESLPSREGSSISSSTATPPLTPTQNVNIISQTKLNQRKRRSPKSTIPRRLSIGTYSKPELDHQLTIPTQNNGLTVTPNLLFPTQSQTLSNQFMNAPKMNFMLPGYPFVSIPNYPLNFPTKNMFPVFPPFNSMLQFPQSRLPFQFDLSQQQPQFNSLTTFNGFSQLSNPYPTLPNWNPPRGTQ